jgi:hypothetical protein
MSRRWRQIRFDLNATGVAALATHYGEIRNEADKLGPRSHMQLPENVAEVVLNRLGADEQPCRDFTIREAITDEKRHPALAPCQLIGGHGLPRPPPAKPSFGLENPWLSAGTFEHAECRAEVSVSACVTAARD